MKTRKTICLTTQEFPPETGEIGLSVKRVALLLKDLGYEVHVAVFRSVFYQERKLAKAGVSRRSHSKTEEQDGIIVHHLYPGIRLLAAPDQEYLMDIYGQLTTLYKKYQFEVVHAFYINETGFLTTMLARENDIAVINSIRATDLNRCIFDCQQQKQIAWTLENSSWTTFVNRNLMHRARLLAPSIRYKSSAFLNSVTPLDFSDLSVPTLTNQLEGTIIGTLANFEAQRGIEYLLDACTNLVTDFTLLFVGDFDPRNSEYWSEGLIQSGLADKIVVTGKVNRQETLACLSLIDIFTIPSVNDSCFPALLEAMLAERAVIGTNVGAIADFIEDGINGLLVNPYSSEELVIAISKLISRPLVRDIFGKSARNKVLEQLNPAMEKYNWGKIYNRILSKDFQSPMTMMAV